MSQRFKWPRRRKEPRWKRINETIGVSSSVVCKDGAKKPLSLRYARGSSPVPNKVPTFSQQKLEPPEYVQSKKTCSVEKKLCGSSTLPHYRRSIRFWAHYCQMVSHHHRRSTAYRYQSKEPSTALNKLSVRMCSKRHARSSTGIKGKEFSNSE